MKTAPDLPDVHFGDVSDDEHLPVDHVEGHDDDDDEELETTPADVIELLGFDPKELDDDEPVPTTDHRGGCGCHQCQIKR